MDDISNSGGSKILGEEKLSIENYEEWFRFLEFWLSMNELDWVVEDLISAAAINNGPLNIKRVNGKVKFSIYQGLEQADKVLINIKPKTSGYKVIQMLKLKYKNKRSLIENE